MRSHIRLISTLFLAFNHISTQAQMPNQSVSGAYPGFVSTHHAAISNSHLPIHFEANEGQAPRELHLIAHAPGFTLGLETKQIVFGIDSSRSPVRLRFLGANAGTLRGENLLPGKVNYISGSDSGSWHRNISTYSRARYSSLYPGIDALFYGQGNELEYDLIVAPGADPRSIRWEVEGADRLAVMRNGDLRISANSAVLVQHPPAIYQIVNGQRQVIRGGFRLRGRLLTLSIPQYDRRRELIIDPKIVYSTYLGGSQDDELVGVALDAQNNTYIVGQGTSPDFPGLAAPANSSPYIFVAKLNPDGSQMIYTTRIQLSDSGPPANQSLRPTGIDVDLTGNAYIVGVTNGQKIPLVNPIQPLLDGGSLFSSTDGASTWSMSTSAAVPTILSIAVDPANGAVAYAGGTLAFDNHPINPILLKTTDGGKTWTPLNAFVPNASATLFPAFVNQVVVSPADRNIVFAATDAGLFRSNDAGSTWAKVLDGGIVSMFIDPLSPNKIETPSFSSTDGGSTWQQTSIYPSNSFRLVLDSKDAMVFGITYDPGAQTLFSSLWHKPYDNIFANPVNGGLPKGAHPQALVWLPGTSTVLVGTTQGIFRTDDAGQNWGPSNQGLNSINASSFAVDPRNSAVVSAATTQGVYVSHDSGQSWTATAGSGLSNPTLRAIAVDPSNSSHMYAGADASRPDGFAVKLSTDGSTPLYSTYLGGVQPASVAVSSTGTAYIGGSSFSSVFLGADHALAPSHPQVTCQEIDFGVFSPFNCGQPLVGAIASGGNSFMWTRWLGSGASFRTTLNSVAVDSSGNLHMAGVAGSTDLPTVNAFQPQCSSDCQGDAFVAKVSADGSRLLYSSYLGGSAYDEARAIAVDASGAAYVTGFTFSTDFPTVNAFQPALGNNNNVFVAKIAPDGSHIAYSTYLGGHSPVSQPGGDQVGTSGDIGLSIAVDAFGEAFVGGLTSSPDFPTTKDSFMTFQGGNCYGHTVLVCVGDAFIARLDPSGQLLFSTFLGGNDQDIVMSLRTDPVGNTVAGGITTSSNFPTVNALQTTYKGNNFGFFGPTGFNAFITKLTFGRPDFGMTLSSSALQMATGQSSSVTASITSINSFAGSVALSCAGLPQGATCSFSPATINLAPGQTTTATITVAVSAPATTSAARLGGFFLLPLGLISASPLWRRIAKGSIIRRASPLLLLTCMLTLAALLLVGCQGVLSMGPSPTPAPPPGAQSFTLVVNATSGPVTHSSVVSISGK